MDIGTNSPGAATPYCNMTYSGVGGYGIMIVIRDYMEGLGYRVWWWCDKVWFNEFRYIMV